LTFGQFSKTFEAIFDSGSTHSLINLEAARKINVEINKNATINIWCGNSSLSRVVGTLNMAIQMGHKKIQHEFIVVDKLIFSFVIGTDIISSSGIIPNLRKSQYHFEDEPSLVYKLGSSDEKFLLVLQERPISDFKLNSEERQIQELLARFPKVIRKDGSSGITSFAVHKIDAPEEPVADPVRHYPPRISLEVQRQVDELLKHGLIRPSLSSYGFNPVLTPKSNGTIRMAINYKGINKKTRKNSMPMPKPHVILRFRPEDTTVESI
jgi:hypothetical protein